MNRLVLIGNGFDLAHGLKTSYADFVDWYWERRMFGFNNDYSDVSEDLLCSFRILNDKREERETWSTLAFAHSYFRSIPALGKKYVGKDVIASIIEDTDHFEVKYSPFFERIIKGIETKGWVDVEDEYYKLLIEYALPVIHQPFKKEGVKELNEQLHYLQELLVEYLNIVTQQEAKIIPSIKSAISSCLREEDMSIDGVNLLAEHKAYWEKETIKDDGPIEAKIDKFGWDYGRSMNKVRIWKEAPKLNTKPEAFMLPNDIMFLNFNYTDTVQHYIKPRYKNCENHIHGDILNPQSVIFGYGDELDSDFVRLQNLNDNECLQNVKSIRYLETPNYRAVLRFIESAPFQVLIMGHSCGNSDRTLLNTIFEHRNCVSIKPYYYVKEDGTDNYIELVQNISRNFTDMKLMRDRVVNKTQCEPLVRE